MQSLFRRSAALVGGCSSTDGNNLMPQKSSNGTARKAVPGKEEMMRKASTEDSGRGLELSVVLSRCWMHCG